MCIVCHLRKENWDYWELFGSGALHDQVNKSKFYSVLFNYLNNSGPYFRNEIIDRLKLFIPTERRTQIVIEAKFEDYFSRNILSPKELRKNDIQTTSFQETAIRYLPAD